LSQVLDFFGTPLVIALSSDPLSADAGPPPAEGEEGGGPARNPPDGQAMRGLGVRKSRDPQLRAKIAAARRGKARPPHVLEAMHQARRGSHHSQESRRKMSETRRKRGILVPGTIPWTPEEDELLKALPAEEVASKAGRSLPAVYARRRRLGMPDGRCRH
jgi:hypothetical protein